MTCRLTIFWLLLASCLTTLSHGKEEELSEYVVSECYGDIFNFDCGRGNKIRINKDFFGYSKARACRYGQGECIISNPKSNSLIHRFCTGHRVCTYYLVERRGCGGSFSNYQQVEYQCIPDSMVTDICSTVDYKASSTYIASPNFPENYPPKLNCRCMVSATSPKAKVRMEIVYLAIKYTHPCRDWLSIGMRRTCGTTMDLFQGRRIPIEFNSDSDDSHSGFWLHFKSSIPGEQVHVQCGNITFRPSKRPDIHHERVSGSEGGDDSADVIHRRPRPEDVPEERPLYSSGKVKKPSRTKYRPDTSLDSDQPPGIGDDPSSGKGKPASTSAKPETTSEGFLSGSEDVKSLVSSTTTIGTLDIGTRDSGITSSSPSSNGRNPSGTLSDIFEIGEGANVPLFPERQPAQNEKMEDEVKGNKNDPSAGGSKMDRSEDPTDAKENIDDSSLSYGVSTQSTSDRGPNDNESPPKFQNKGKQNSTISRLNDKETWGKPADNDLNTGDTVFSDNNSFHDDKSQSNIDSNGGDEAHNPGTMSGATNPDKSTTNSGFSTTVRSIITTTRDSNDFLTLGIIIVCICVGVGLLLVCAVLLIVYFKRHHTRDEETQTPRQKPASDGDSGQGLLVAGSSKNKDYYANKVDKSLQIDLDSDYDDAINFSAHLSAMNHLDEGDESSMYSGPCSDPNCKGVQVTTNSLAKARFRDNKKRKRTKMLIGKSSSSGIDVKGCDSVETTEGSSSESGKPPFRPISDFSDPGSFTCSEPELGLDHKRSLASMSQYSEVTLMPENAVLPSNNEFYDSFSDPEWDQKSAISI